MGTIVVVVLILIFIAMPFATFAKVSSIAAEIRELKIMVKNLGILNVRAEAKSAVEVAPKVERTPEPVTKPLVPPHVPAVKTPKERLPQEAVPQPEPAPVSGFQPARVPEPTPEPVPAPAPEPMNRPVVRDEPEMSVFDLFWAKFEDWFCVRGDFAPKGTTRDSPSRRAGSRAWARCCSWGRLPTSSCWPSTRDGSDRSSVSTA